MRIAPFAIIGLSIIASTASSLIDYDELNLNLRVNVIRAGNHDPSGQNDYYFKVTQAGLVNTNEERLKDLKERRMIPVEVGTFGEVSMKPLSFWHPPEEVDEETTVEENVIQVTGDSIRELTSRVMSEFQLTEENVAHMVSIELWERNKQFIFFGEDQFIAKTHFFPIPPTQFDVPSRVNQTLEIEDDKGTHVEIGVEWENPIKSKAQNQEAAAFRN